MRLSHIARGYGRQFRDSFTVLHASLMGLCSAANYIFVPLSPYVPIERIGLTPSQFGLWWLVPSIGLGIRMFLTFAMAGKVRPRIAMLLGVLLLLAGILPLAISFSNDLVNPYTLFLSVAILLMGTSIIWAFASSKALSESTDKSNASAVIQFITISYGMLGTLFIGLFSPSELLLLPAAFTLILILMISVWLKLRAHHLRSP